MYPTNALPALHAEDEIIALGGTVVVVVVVYGDGIMVTVYGMP
jgi:hypothetical protein